MNENIKNIKESIKKLKDKMLVESKQVFKDASAAIFEKYPQIESFSWTQYTPYFADGDECIFGVNSDPSINGKDEYENEKFGFPDAYKEIRQLINSIDEEMLKLMFGDHCEVVVTKEDVEIRDYDHD